MKQVDHCIFVCVRDRRRRLFLMSRPLNGGNKHGHDRWVQRLGDEGVAEYIQLKRPKRQAGGDEERQDVPGSETITVNRAHGERR